MAPVKRSVTTAALSGDCLAPFGLRGSVFQVPRSSRRTPYSSPISVQISSCKASAAARGKACFKRTNPCRWNDSISSVRKIVGARFVSGTMASAG